MSYKSVWDFGREGKANYSVHKIGEYPSKIRPIVFAHLVERFSNKGDVILDPFAGSGTVAVEAKLQGRNSISYDINPNAIELTRKKLEKLDAEEMKRAYKELFSDLRKDFQTVLGNEELNHHSKLREVQVKKEVKKLQAILEDLENPNSDYLKTKHIAEVRDSRQLDLPDESVDAIITDIPYASMIKYSDLKEDLSTIEDYDEFLNEISKSFSEMARVLKKDKYCVILVADYRIGASRKILPIHADVINIMQELGLTLFDLYIWRYYRSGGFRPFGKKPFQAMNVHSYILVFHKPNGAELSKANRSPRYRHRLVEKIEQNRPKGL
jgi:DNA modification methylase